MENENNIVKLTGEITENFTYSHKVKGKKFYFSKIAVKRLSGLIDYIPIKVKEGIIDVNKDLVGECVNITGRFHSFMEHKNNTNKLVLSVFVSELEVLEKIDEEVNQILLDGYICKKPIYRKTPTGREISDLFIAVHRPNGKSDYIPCICWWGNARFVDFLEIGTRLKIVGRIQSREYFKHINDTESYTRIAYEVSVSTVELQENLENESKNHDVV